MEPYVAVTNPEWFFNLRRGAGPDGLLDEVNFWNPSGAALKSFLPGDPVFFRLKAPYRRIAGYGIFATFTRLRLAEAWEFFGRKNGCEDPFELARLTGKALSDTVGCTILRGVVLRRDEHFLPWGDAEGWKGTGPQRGKSIKDLAMAQRLRDEIAYDSLPVLDELRDAPFAPLEADERQLVMARTVRREGQGTFRTRLLDVYKRRCAITGEHTEIVLDAAHIQPYLGPRSNHLQNGMLLTKEFHALFDAGYVTVTPEHEVRISARLYSEWKNGRRYRPFDGQRLIMVPESSQHQPSPQALRFHATRVFKQ